MQNEEKPWRMEYESDPASPRPVAEIPGVGDFPKWSGMQKLLSAMGSPGLSGLFFQVREWFRDNNMKLFFRLHHALKDSDWLEDWDYERSRKGSFWQDGSEGGQQDFSFVIYPGEVQGRIGTDILVVNALEPGHLGHYKKAKAVISRSGGRLSHGATLLREIQVPSAVIADLPEEIEKGQMARLNGAKFQLLT